jgi:hypothetical protein
MARRHRQVDLPPSGASPRALEHARALARLLAQGGELPWAPVPDLQPGETGHAFWTDGVYAARYSRSGGSQYVPPISGGYVGYAGRFPLITAANIMLRHSSSRSRRRQWQPIGGGQPLVLAVTSHRLVLGTGDVVPLASITELTPRTRDLSILDFDSTVDAALRLWGDHVPRLVVILTWLLRREVIAVPEGDGSPVTAAFAVTTTPSQPGRGPIIGARAQGGSRGEH